MTSGYPYETFLRLEPYLDYPGKFPEDPRLGRLDKIRKRLLKQQRPRAYDGVYLRQGDLRNGAQVHIK